MRILIVEDERKLSNNVKKGLVEDGYAVDQAFDGEEGLYLAESESYDAIILDIMLPKMNGVVLCTEFRKKGNATPILMLTAKSSIEDKVKGLDAGADDYLVKPFEFVELKSRINALIRRSSQKPMPIIMIGDIEIDTIHHTVKRHGKELMFTPKEFAILEFMTRHKDEVVTRTQIIEHVWDYNFDNMSNVVDVFVTTLRKKIKAHKGKKLIHTIHGVGYKLSDPNI